MRDAQAYPIGIVGSIQIGLVSDLGPQRVPSGFVKRPVLGPVSVDALGLDGDEQADLSVHGGADKAVYGYAGSHYVAWTNDFPEHRDRFTAGSLGENLTIEGIDETELCVGDTHRIGSALLQVCQPRQPCFKLALRFDDNRLPKAMVRSERSGWYYRGSGAWRDPTERQHFSRRPSASGLSVRPSRSHRLSPPSIPGRAQGHGGNGRACLISSVSCARQLISR